VNKDLFKVLDAQSTYFTAFFLSPGKHNFFVEQMQSVRKLYFSRNIIEMRPDLLPNNVK
jgi:hypothetical protein